MGARCFHCAGVMGHGHGSISILVGIVQYEKLFHFSALRRERLRSYRVSLSLSAISNKIVLLIQSNRRDRMPV